MAYNARRRDRDSSGLSAGLPPFTYSQSLLISFSFNPVAACLPALSVSISSPGGAVSTRLGSGLPNSDVLAPGRLLGPAANLRSLSLSTCSTGV